MRLFGDGASYAAKADYAHDLAFDALQVGGLVVYPLPVALDAAVVDAQAALEEEHQGYGVLRRLLGAVVLNGHHSYALFRCVVYVHLVEAGGLEGDDAAFLQRVQLLAAEVDIAVDYYVRIGYVLIEFVVILAVLVKDGNAELGALGEHRLLYAHVPGAGARSLCKYYLHFLHSLPFILSRFSYAFRKARRPYSPRISARRPYPCPACPPGYIRGCRIRKNVPADAAS